MDLKTFISESLSQIIEGVETAQKENARSFVIPANANALSNSACTKDVEFDVAVTVEKEAATKGGIAVFAGVLGLGSQGKSSQSDQTVSRIKFSVPILFQGKAGQQTLLSSVD